ncbi:MAG: hypothetical protein Q8Q23_02395 [bacterium]|nr:hypothetical protein [bacterium]
MPARQAQAGAVDGLKEKGKHRRQNECAQKRLDDEVHQNQRGQKKGEQKVKWVGSGAHKVNFLSIV